MSTDAKQALQIANRRRWRRTVVRHSILIGWGLIIMFPIFWMIQTSFKDAHEWVTWPPH